MEKKLSNSAGDKMRDIRKLLTAFVVLVIILILSSCSIPFIPEVPPSSYSLEAAVNVLSNKYTLLESGWINGFGDIQLGDGRFAIFDGVDGFFMLFKYESNEEAKENWNKITKKYGNPLKIKYMKVNMGDYGVFTVRLESTDLYAWFKENWLIVVTGDKIEGFVRDVNEIYNTVKR
ncbi:Protein of unknown function [Fervidobacterium gondwanense DSM 13020]|uniref:DUF3242 domain-containing protein n=2 Tax=Fervidobacteriaceae TaxID=1643950 RepID=A0A1M7SWT4_FERGO|nr:Protein of unknown function [Fervidobacterium gondwanense DSM 13020]